MRARSPSFVAGLLASVVGLVVAVDPRSWVSGLVGWSGVALVVVGGGVAFAAAVRSPRAGIRMIAVMVAVLPAALLLGFILLLIRAGD